MVQITLPANNLKSAYLEEPPIPPTYINWNTCTWDELYGCFTDKERKELLQNFTYYIGICIRRNLQKSKEALRKLRESSR